jgi:ketosteroid isomerase-like protein
LRIFGLALTVTSLLLIGCATTATMNNDAEAYIQAASPRFAEAVNRGDWETIGSFYADDAVMMAPNAEVARGSATIRQAWSAFGAMRPRLTLATDRVVQSCDMAYETGTYQLQLSPAGSAPIQDRGKYVTVWQRIPGGQWKLVADIFNTSLPAPEM